jgi:hypothetical protein
VALTAPRNTVKVIARHRADCPVKDSSIVGNLEKFPELARWRCPKALVIYEGDRKRQRMVAARTTLWSQAEKQAQEHRDSWDPRLARLRQLEAEREAQQTGGGGSRFGNSRDYRGRSSVFGETLNWRVAGLPNRDSFSSSL